MKTSKRGLIEICESEGIVVERYLDVVMVWTIGVGHTKAAGGLDPKKFLGTMSVEDCLNLFIKDVVKYENRVRQALKGKDVEQHVFDGLVSFDYNTGGVKRASFMPYLLSGNMKEAKRRFLFWNKPSSIIGRRKKEAALIFSGKYSSDHKVPVYTSTVSYKPLFSHLYDVGQWLDTNTSKDDTIVEEQPKKGVERVFGLQLFFKHLREFITNLLKGFKK